MAVRCAAECTTEPSVPKIKCLLSEPIKQANDPQKFIVPNYAHNMPKKIPIVQFKKQQNKMFKNNKQKKNELPHDKTNKMACSSSEDSDQPGRTLILLVLSCRSSNNYMYQKAFMAQN